MSAIDPAEYRRRQLTALAGQDGIYFQDGLVTGHNHDFMRDPAFAAAYARGVQAAGGTDYHWHWRVHVGLWAAQTALQVPGDFVECGVNAGFLGSAIMHRLGWNGLGRTFWLLDTFAGIDPRFVTDAERADGIMEKDRQRKELGFYVEGGLEAARRNFAEWPSARIVEGAIPESLPRLGAERIAFLHIDLNCAMPEVAALEHCWPRLVPGAVILLDDYAFRGYHHQKRAMDEAASRLGLAIASLPTGQGLAVRGGIPAG